MLFNSSEEGGVGRDGLGGAEFEGGEGFAVSSDGGEGTGADSDDITN